MTTTAYVVTGVVLLALLLQLVFSVAYWVWIPAWVKDSYGRMAQLGAWCHIIFLSVFESFIFFGRHMNVTVAGFLLVASFVPLIVYGFLQIVLLRRAVLSARMEGEQQGESEISDRSDPGEGA